VFKSKDGVVLRESERIKREYSPPISLLRPSVTAFDNGRPTVIAKADHRINRNHARAPIRSPAGGGRVHRALQDGLCDRYHERERFEELWRFQTSARRSRARPVTYAIRPEQFFSRCNPAGATWQPGEVDKLEEFQLPVRGFRCLN